MRRRAIADTPLPKATLRRRADGCWLLEIPPRKGRDVDHHAQLLAPFGRYTFPTQKMALQFLRLVHENWRAAQRKQTALYDHGVLQPPACT
jgi:hypothetical protein